MIANELTQISAPDVVIFTNCEQVRLTWLNKVIGTRAPEQGVAMPHPPITFPGVFVFKVLTERWRDRLEQVEMVAEGLIGGTVVCRTVKKYAQRTAAIRVMVDDRRVPLRADGADFVPVRAWVVDANGMPKVLASEEVHFAVRGPGHIIGEASTQANPMKTQFGVATALVRADVVPGEIEVTAWAQGLKPGSVVLRSLAPLHELAFQAIYRKQSADAAEGAAGALAPAMLPSGGDADLLRTDNERLRAEKTSLQQEVMELKTRLAKSASP